MDDAISVVVVAKDDPGLATTIDCLLAERASLGMPVELIVVDSSIDERCASMSERYGGSVLWRRYEPPTSSKRVTIPEQRNLGVRSANGAIVVFIDANCKPCSGWLAYLVGPLLNDGEYMTVGPALATSSRDDMWTLKKSTRSETGREYVDYAPTINIAIRKEVFDDVGLFDESFLYGSDHEFTVRAVSNGYRIRFVKEAAVTHDWGTIGDQMRRSGRYAEAKVRMYAKMPSMRRRLLGPDLQTLAYPLFIIMLPITRVFRWFPLVLLVPLAKNARHSPIKTVLMNLWYGVCVLVHVCRFATGAHR